MRVTLYVVQVLSEDEETSKQGVVVIHWPLQMKGALAASSIIPLRKAAMCSPVRISAFHFCLSEAQQLAAMATKTILLTCPEYKARGRLHVGT